jgi:hypothetical protein
MEVGRHQVRAVRGWSRFSQSVFMNMSISPVFQILGGDRQASRSRFIVHICPSPIKQTILLMDIPLVHDTFPKSCDKMVMDFRRANVFHVQKLNHQC